MSDKLSEILWDFHRKSFDIAGGSHDEYDYEIVETARIQILDWVRDELLPKQKQGIAYLGKIGFSDCLREIKERIETWKNIK
jgi:hypothetical protein